MAESSSSKSTGTSESDTPVNKEFEKASELQAEVKNKRAAEDELLNATTEDGVIAAANRYNEIV